MATRNVTARYVQLRTAIRGPGHPAAPDPDGPAAAEDAPLTGFGDPPGSGAPVWVATVERVRDVEAAVRSRMARLKELHAAHLKPQFGKDEEKEEQAINALTAEIKREFQEAEKAIKRMVAVEGASAAERGADQQKLLQNVQLSLVTQMSALSKHFGDEQRKYLSEVKKQKERAKKLVTFGSRTPEEEEQERREVMLQQYLEKGFTAEQVQALTFNEQMIAERDAELQHILSSIVDLHDVFKDLHSLVIDQGTLLDRIDYNVEETKQQVVKGTQELHRMLVRQEKSRFLMVVLCLVAGILLLLFLIVARSALR
jgi:syntaxin 16